MKKARYLTKGLILGAAVAAMAFILSCSGEEGGGPSTEGDKDKVSSSSDGGDDSGDSSSSGDNENKDSSSSVTSNSSSSTESESSSSVRSSSSVGTSSSSSTRSSSSIGTSSSSRSSSSIGSSSSSRSSSSDAGSSSSVGGGGSSSSTGTTTACPPSKRTWDDEKYGTRTNNVVDIKLPSSGNGPWPLIIFVHGGAWSGSAGSENSVTAPFGQAITKGYALASVRYTYTGSSIGGGSKAYPESAEDILTAIRFLRAKAADYCINPDKIGITGYSSGGYFTHLAAALSGVSNHGFDKDNLNVAGVPAGVSSKVQAAASCSGLSDLAKLDDHKTEAGVGSMQHCQFNTTFFGFNPCTATGANKVVVENSNPVKHIQEGNCADIPPVLSMHGKKDGTVPWLQSKVVSDAIKAKCGESKTKLYTEDNLDHSCPSGQDAMIWQFLDAALK